VPTGHHKTEKRYHVLYRTTCTVTGKFYLGIHSTDDIDDGYLGSGLYIQRSVEKHGREAHTVEHVALFETRAELLAAEKALVVVGGKSMNLVDGGGDPPHYFGEDHHNWGGGEKISAETREKMRQAKLGTACAAGPHDMTPEGSKRIGDAARRAHTGKVNSPETRARMSAGQRKRFAGGKSFPVVSYLRKNHHFVPCRINLLSAEGMGS
jgi:hypothetical protein